MSERAIKMVLCAEQVPSSSLKRTSLNRPSAKHRSSKPSRVLLNWSSMCRSWSKLTNFCCPEVAASLRIENKSGMSRNSAAWKQNLMSYLNHGRLYRWTENETDNMRPELQSQNRVNGDCEKTTGPIYLKFWQKFLLMGITEIQK